MGSLIIEKSKLKAIVSEKRIKILKALLSRRHTITELASLLKTTKSNLFIHLEKLKKAGLVRKVDDNHKWKYYALTEEGKVLLTGKGIAIPITLILASLFAIVAIGFNGVWLLEKSIRESVALGSDSEFSFFPIVEFVILAILGGCSFLLLVYGIFEFAKTRSLI